MQKEKHNWINDDSDDFLLAVLQLDSLAEARAFFGDVCTDKEMSECAKRWKAAKMLDIGLPYRKVGKATGMSSATIARIRTKMKSGFGGYRLMLQKLHTDN